MNYEPSRLPSIFFVIVLAGSLLLIGMGLVFACDHALAARSYGVPLAGGPDNSWISSAALRDFAFGGLTLALTLLRDRRAVGLCLLFGAIIPLGDAIVV